MNEDAITVRSLHKRYGDVVAVHNLDLAVPRGAIFGLLGPNGAGKSTTFGILCGWLRATSGTATVLGVDVDRLHTLQGRVAALPQDASFPSSMSVRAQLTHYARLTGLDGRRARVEADRVLARVGLSDASGRRGRELSHGMSKRAGIAQALIGAPEVVMLDEPTSGLDPLNAREVRDLIAELAPACTVVVSSHNLAEVQELCTHGAILDHGHLTASGTIDELTGRGQVVLIRVRGDTSAALAALRAAFDPDSVDGDAGDGMLRVSHAVGEDPAAVVATALRALLAVNAPVVGVALGTSLESAFLRLTATGR